MKKQIPTQIKGFSEKKFDWYLAVTRGGLQTAMLLSKITDQRSIDTFCVQSYENENQRSQVKIIEKNFSHLENKTVLLVDDLVDSGETYKEILKYLQKWNIKEIKTFVTYRKSETSFEPDYYLMDWDAKEWINFNYDEPKMTWEIMTKYGLKLD